MPKDNDSTDVEPVCAGGRVGPSHRQRTRLLPYVVGFCVVAVAFILTFRAFKVWSWQLALVSAVVLALITWILAALAREKEKEKGVRAQQAAGLQQAAEQAQLDVAGRQAHLDWPRRQLATDEKIK
jgi:hypothetical protein